MQTTKKIISKKEIMKILCNSKFHFYPTGKFGFNVDGEERDEQMKFSYNNKTRGNTIWVSDGRIRFNTNKMIKAVREVMRHDEPTGNNWHTNFNRKSEWYESDKLNQLLIKVNEMYDIFVLIN